MSTKDNDNSTNNVLIGALIGGVLGVCLTSIFMASRNREGEGSFGSIGRLALQMGEMLEECHVKSGHAFKETEKKVHKHEDTISDVLALVSAGISLWNKIKEGK